MLMLDANLLIYAYHAESEEHVAAKAWVEAVLSGTEAVGLPWQTILESRQVKLIQDLGHSPSSLDPRSILHAKADVVGDAQMWK